MGRRGKSKETHAHGKTHDAIRRIEKADIAGVDPALGWHPRQNKEIDIDRKRKDEDHIPRTEFAPRDPEGRTAPAEGEEAEREEESEDVFGVRLEIDDWVLQNFLKV